MGVSEHAICLAMSTAWTGDHRGSTEVSQNTLEVCNKCIAARILYSQKWKDEEFPTKEEWISKVMDYVE